MRLDSRLQKSRHGIYYLRVQRHGLDRRWSLHTRDPNVAAIAAHELSAKLLTMAIDFSRARLGWVLRTHGTDIEITTEDNDADRKSATEALIIAMQNRSTSPTPSESVVQQAPTPKFTTSLSDAMAAYIPHMYTLKTMSDKTKGEAEVALNKVVRFMGANYNMWEFTNNRVRSDWMFKRKLEKSNRNLVVNDEVFMVNGKPVKDEVSWSTVEKELSWVRGFSQWAAEEDREYCESVLTMTIPEGEGVNKSYEKFSQIELKTIFDALPSAAVEPWQFWIPLIGLYTGARVGEPAALLVKHFERESKLDIMFLPGTKTDCSPRHIPIHPDLIELGLLDFVAKRKLDGFSRLFDCPISESNGAGAMPSKWFGSFLDTVKITSKTKVFHSFRHTLIALLKSRGSDLEARCQYVGHGSIGSAVHRSYGGDDSGLGMPLIKMRVVDFIDWDAYYEWSPDIAKLKVKADTFIS